MYAVVGCRDCDALWVVDGEPGTTGCPRCGTRHRFDRLRTFAETDDEDRAKQARAALLAERGGHGDAFAELDGFDEMEEAVRDAVVSDEEYLGGAGVDVDEVEAAGERASVGRTGSRRSRPDTVRAALRELDDPIESAVVDYAAEHGVPRETARELLERLVRAGEASEDGGRYRLL